MKLTNQIAITCPWAWFYSEFKKLYGLKSYPFSEHHFFNFAVFAKQESILGKTTLPEILKNSFGYRGDARPLALFRKSKTVNMNIFASDRLIFKQRSQAEIRRLLLEYTDLKKAHKPVWFEVLNYLCDTNVGCSTKEIAKNFKVIRQRIAADLRAAPKFFRENVQMITKKELLGEPTYYKIQENFYKNIYLPLKPWLTPKGFEVFREWKKEYHFSGESELAQNS